LCSHIKTGGYGFFVGFGVGLPGFMPLRLRFHGFVVGFGVGLPGFMPLRLFFGHALAVGFGLGFMALRAVLITLAILAAGLTDFVDFVALVVVLIAFEPVAAMAVPVKRKAAAVNDASSFFKVCSSFP